MQLLPEFTVTIPETADFYAPKGHKQFLIIDWGNATIDVEGRHESQNAVTEYEWNGHQDAYTLPQGCVKESIEDVLETLAQSIADRLNDYRAHTDSQRGRASFDNGQAPTTGNLHERLVDALAEADHEGAPEVWDAADWIGATLNELVTATTTDEEIEATAKKVVADATIDNAILDQDETETVLRDHRDLLAA